MPSQLTFFNTVNESGKELQDCIDKVKSQADRILDLMPQGVELTPPDVHKLYEAKYGHVPITSIRRAMTDLSNLGKLEKCNSQRREAYGVKNYKWKKI